MQEAGPNTPLWSSLPTEPPLPLPRHTQSKIRPFDFIQSSSYFKIRALLKDLRPLVIEVLRTPNFQDCKAAEEIRANLKILMNIYRQMITETTFLEEANNFVPEDQTPRNIETGDTEKDQTDQTLQSGFASDELQDGDGATEELLVGGSAFGWNFIMDRSGESKSTYYGMTKEAFRIKQEEWR